MVKVIIMRNTSKRAEYTAISLPKDLMDDVKQYIDIHQKYRSQAEFTKAAIIEKMQRDVIFNELLRTNCYMLPNDVSNQKDIYLLTDLKKTVKDIQKKIDGMYPILFNISEHLPEK